MLFRSLPLGQTFTMLTVQDAVDAALDVQARIAIPIHWGNAEGTLADATFFTSTLANRMTTMINTPPEGFALEVSDTVVFAEHPASQTVAPGTSATLGVQATGTGALRYQWRRNGVALVGATAATLPVAAAAAANAGDYTVIVSSPPGVPALTTAFPGTTIQAVTPGARITLGGIEVETVPMYNVVRTNHLRALNFVGYVVNVGGVRVYHGGDTERFPEMKTFTADVAMLPLGQTFTMLTVQDAVDSALDVQARIAIPIHWGNAEGTLADANFFV